VSLRDRSGMNLVGVAAQDLGFGPGARIQKRMVWSPPAEINRRPSLVNSSRQTYPMCPSSRTMKRPVAASQTRMLESSNPGQKPALGRQARWPAWSAVVPFVSALPEFLTCGEIETLNVVAVVRSVRPHDIETPVVRGKPGCPMKPAIAQVVGWRLSICERKHSPPRLRPRIPPLTQRRSPPWNIWENIRSLTSHLP